GRAHGGARAPTGETEPGSAGGRALGPEAVRRIDQVTRDAPASAGDEDGVAHARRTDHSTEAFLPADASDGASRPGSSGGAPQPCAFSCASTFVVQPGGDLLSSSWFSCDSEGV